MPLSEGAKSAVGSAIMQVVGRRNLARAARFLTNVARLDVTNNLLENGETLVQDTVIAHTPEDNRLIAVDVGANAGLWTLEFCARCEGREYSVHAFEPVTTTAEIFRNNVRNSAVTLNTTALSDTCGTAQISVHADGAGTNALVPDAAAPVQYVQNVSLATFDDYCEEYGLNHVSLLKTDAEGHDLFVLRGAKGMFSRQRIAVAQFEYNHRWIWSRVFLRDAFDFAGEFGYHLGKVTKRGIEFYGAWDKELEKFQEGNYLLCRGDWMSRFPRIRWWADEKGRR